MRKWHHVSLHNIFRWTHTHTQAWAMGWRQCVSKRQWVVSNYSKPPSLSSCTPPLSFSPLILICSSEAQIKVPDCVYVRLLFSSCSIFFCTLFPACPPIHFYFVILIHGFGVLHIWCFWLAISPNTSMEMWASHLGFLCLLLFTTGCLCSDFQLPLVSGALYHLLSSHWESIFWPFPGSFLLIPPFNSPFQAWLLV